MRDLFCMEDGVSWGRLGARSVSFMEQRSTKLARVVANHGIVYYEEVVQQPPLQKQRAHTQGPKVLMQHLVLARPWRVSRIRCRQEILLERFIGFTQTR